MREQRRQQRAAGVETIISEQSVSSDLFQKMAYIRQCDEEQIGITHTSEGKNTLDRTV